MKNRWHYLTRNEILSKYKSENQDSVAGSDDKASNQQLSGNSVAQMIPREKGKKRPLSSDELSAVEILVNSKKQVLEEPTKSDP